MITALNAASAPVPSSSTSSTAENTSNSRIEGGRIGIDSANGISSNAVIESSNNDNDNTNTNIKNSDSTNLEGLSRSFQTMFSRSSTQRRQRFVTGEFPVVVSVVENHPTLQWLNLGRSDISTAVVLVNGTTIDRSLADFDRYQWLDDVERQDLHDRYATVSMELLAEINIAKPGYLHILPSTNNGPGSAASRKSNAASLASSRNAKDGHDNENTIHQPFPFSWLQQPKQQQQKPTTHMNRYSNDQGKDEEQLWVTGFSLASRKGFIKSMDVRTGRIRSVNTRSGSMIQWPNEVNHVPRVTRNLHLHHDRKQQQDPSKQPSLTTLKAQSPTPTSTQTSTSSETTTHNGFFDKLKEDAILVSDGFLVPGKDRGGIYVVTNPTDTTAEWTIRLTNPVSRDGSQWFYHRATWVDLTGDGRLSVLTARAKLRKGSDSTVVGGESVGNGPVDGRQRSPSMQNYEQMSSVSTTTDRSTTTGTTATTPTTTTTNGQLLWLEMPQPHHFDEETGTPLEEDGTEFDPFSSRHLPWKEHVLATGPDVMFAVADLDPTDDTIEVVASQFFDKKVTLHSIQRGMVPKVTFSRIIDHRCGAAFGCILADLDGGTFANGSHNKLRHHVLDSGSSISSLKTGDAFSHLLVTSHECDYATDDGDKLKDDYDSVSRLRQDSLPGHGRPLDLHQSNVNNRPSKTELVEGGSLFSYRVPSSSRRAWETEPWQRTTVTTGFQVNSQLWNVINPGAPGFCYTFHAHKDDAAKGKRPLIAVAGDCAESAYIFRPQRRSTTSGTGHWDDSSSEDVPNTDYKLMCEIKCGSTVGSIAVGYDDLCETEQESGYAKIYIPCFERDKILVFAMGNGEDDYDDIDRW